MVLYIVLIGLEQAPRYVFVFVSPISLPNIFRELEDEGLEPTPEPRKKPSHFPLYWLVNRDPYNGLL